jgi:glycerol transport system ATP-binding protein
VTFVLDHIGFDVGGVRVIDDVCLTFQPSSLNVLLGPTLAGKTTIMRLMAGLDQPTTGRLLHYGQDVTGTPVRKRSVAMVYQQFINYPSLTVYENIASPLRVAGVAKSEIDTRVREAARVLRLENLLQRMPDSFRGASNSAPPSPGRSSSAPSSSCSTSRSPTSTINCARNCARNCRASFRTPARS